MADKARVGSFSAPSGPYGGNIPVVRPADNATTAAAASPTDPMAAENAAAIAALTEQLKQAQLGH